MDQLTSLETSPRITICMPEEAVRIVLLGAQRQAKKVGWIPESKPGTAGTQGKMHGFAQVLPVTVGSRDQGTQGAGEACLTL